MRGAGGVGAKVSCPPAFDSQKTGRGELSTSGSCVQFKLQTGVGVSVQKVSLDIKLLLSNDVFL